MTVSATAPYVLAALLVAGLGWQVAIGRTGLAWWYPKEVTRRETPAVFWLVIAAQVIVLIVLLATGRSWNVRQ